MSRIGRLPITVPSGVDVTIDGRTLTVKGPKGSLTRELHPDMTVAREDDRLVVTRPTEQKTHKQLHGLTRTLVNNMVVGVTDGYRKSLEITGVGYRAAKVGATRKPEPYKGKGVRYAGEYIRRKAGKAGKIGGKK